MPAVLRAPSRSTNGLDHRPPPCSCTARSYSSASIRAKKAACSAGSPRPAATTTPGRRTPARGGDLPAAGVHAVPQAVDAGLLGARGAAEHQVVTGLHAMSEDPAAAVGAGGRDHLRRALDAVEGVFGATGGAHRERLVVLVAAGGALRHLTHLLHDRGPAGGEPGPAPSTVEVGRGLGGPRWYQRVVADRHQRLAPGPVPLAGGWWVGAFVPHVPDDPPHGVQVVRGQVHLALAEQPDHMPTQLGQAQVRLVGEDPVRPAAAREQEVAQLVGGHRHRTVELLPQPLHLWVVAPVTRGRLPVVGRLPPPRAHAPLVSLPGAPETPVGRTAGRWAQG